MDDQGPTPSADPCAATDRVDCTQLDAFLADKNDIVSAVTDHTKRIENPLAPDLALFWPPLTHLPESLQASQVYSGVPRQAGYIDIANKKGLYAFKIATSREETSVDIKELRHQTGLLHVNVDLDRTPKGNLWRISVGGWDEDLLPKVVAAIHSLARLIHEREHPA